MEQPKNDEHVTQKQPDASRRRRGFALIVAMIVVGGLVVMGIFAVPKLAQMHLPSAARNASASADTELTDKGMGSIGYPIADFFKEDGSVNAASVSQLKNDLPYHPAALYGVVFKKLSSFIDEDAKAGSITTEQSQALKEAIKLELGL